MKRRLFSLRNLVSILLMLAMVPLIASVPGAVGQNVTTVTSANTVTTQATFTQETQYAVATSTQTSDVTETVYDSSFVLPGYGQYCAIRSINFEALTGQRVRGTISTNNPKTLYLYLLSEKNYNIFAANTKCDPTYVGASVILYKERITSYTLDWTAPADGTYYLVIEGYSGSDSTITVSLAKYYSEPVTSVSYSTQTSLLIVTATKTLNSIFTQPLVAASAPIDMVTIAAVGIIVLVAVGGAYFVLSKRKSKM